MTSELQRLREQIAKKKEGEAVASDLAQSEQIYELRRENFRLAADVRRLTLDNEMLRSGGHGKKEEATFQEIAKLENQVEDLKSEKMSSERDNSKLLSKIHHQESQLY